MLLPTAALVKTDLSNLAWRMDKAMRASIAEFLSGHAEQRHYYSARTQSSIIHDLIVKNFKAEFEGDSSVSVNKVPNTHETLIHDKYRFRMKKLDPELLSQNIPTQTAIEFRGQVQLPGLEVWNLVVGYLPPKDKTGVLADSRIYITMPNGKKNAWKWEITKFADEKLPTVAANDLTAPPPKRRTGIRIKKDVAKEKDGNGDAAAGDKK